uniref:motility associated factor glycosyltransferase family protein n=1 Tax=Pseudoalteromonas sp. TaxID=53249 RepID=UPI0023544D40
SGSEDGVVNDISKFLFQQGHFNLSQVLFLKHYDSPLIEKTIARIKAIGHRWSGGWGFFEDEVIGISHTLSNLSAKFPVVKKSSTFKNPLVDYPVFIVANGPSLDLAIDFLKENQSNVVILSCGTALKALLINGITPDIHIEMERTAALLDWVEVVERTEGVTTRLDELNIVALNTVYDGILKRFKSAHLLSKVNDAGGRLIRAMDEKQLFTYPESSNPSVSNTGLAVAAELGFKEVYLVGTDFGFVSQEHHHSKHSIYFDKDFKHKELIKKNMQSDMVVKGNFRDEVLSTHIFDSSKGNVEILLQSNPQVTAYNTSDGAFIRFTTPKRIADISLKSTIKNKQEMVSELLKRATSLEQLSLGNIDSKMTAIKSGTKAILEKLLLITSAHFNTRESLADAFTLQNKILLMLRDGNSNDHVVYWLIQGTFRYFQAYIMTNSYYYRCLEQRAEFMNACIDAFHSHVEDLYLEFIENYNKSAKL